MSQPHVDSYRFGRIVVDGEPYVQDLIILPDRVVPNWRRLQGHYLQPCDLKQILNDSPLVLVIGQGAVGRMAVAPEISSMMAEAGIELIVEWSARACQTYNRTKRERPTALALHLTC